MDRLSVEREVAIFNQVDYPSISLQTVEPESAFIYTAICGGTAEVSLVGKRVKCTDVVRPAVHLIAQAFHGTFGYPVPVPISDDSAYRNRKIASAFKYFPVCNRVFGRINRCDRI
jgi:hypothetical protein